LTDLDFVSSKTLIKGSLSRSGPSELANPYSSYSSRLLSTDLLSLISLTNYYLFYSISSLS
jgi:hypothetical protein